MKNKYDWNAIQNYYDQNHTWRELTEKFGVAQSAILKAIKSGKFKSTRDRSDAQTVSFYKGRRPKLTQQIKKKISDSRIKYLTEHPDKVPYRINHSSKKSWPEQVFENALLTCGITGWKYAYQNGIYEYDFAWIEEKIDVEIDGATHRTEKVKRIDARRDQFSRSQGWKVVRFDASKVKNDVIGCINELKTILGSYLRSGPNSKSG
jgi:very-short-patch-repair endonuclease